MNITDLLCGAPFVPPQGKATKHLMDGTSSWEYVPPAELSVAARKGLANREMILDVISQTGYSTTADLAKILGISQVSTRDHIVKLIEQKLLIRFDSKDRKKPTIYILA